MRSSRLAFGRARTVCAWGAVAAALAGCTSTRATSSAIPGHTLTVYASMPHGGSGPELQDVLLAEQLAIHQADGRMGKFTVKLVPAQGNEASDNARAAIADPGTIAYLGELVPGTSGQTLGITNGEDILQVSPTDTAVELTQHTGADPGSPRRYYEALSANGRTFARVVPNDKLEAKVLVGEMQALGVKRLAVASDGSAYGKALRAAVVSAAGSTMSLVSTPTDADGLLYAGNSVNGPTGALQAFDQGISGNPKLKLFAPSALASASFVTALAPTAQRDLYVTSPGFTSADLPPLGQQFTSAFSAAYGHPPAVQAIFGYEAMEALLAVLQRAGSSANSRSTVIHDFFTIRNRSSALGTYSITKTGDIKFAGGAPFILSRVKGGKLVPFKAVHA